MIKVGTYVVTYYCVEGFVEKVIVRKNGKLRYKVRDKYGLLHTYSESSILEHF